MWVGIKAICVISRTFELSVGLNHTEHSTVEIGDRNFYLQKTGICVNLRIRINDHVRCLIILEEAAQDEDGLSIFHLGKN